MSLSFATQLTAIATAALAALAIVTAIVAAFAFWKQSQEVSHLARAGAEPGARQPMDDRPVQR
jgi:hypothetical protein